MKEVTVIEFENLKTKGDKILLELYADWCGPCQKLLPKIETIGKSYPNIHFLKMNVDKNLEFCNNNNIKAVPTILIFDGLRLVNRTTGIKPDDDYINILNNL